MKQILHALSIAWDDLMWFYFKPAEVLESWEVHKLRQEPEDYQKYLTARKRLLETGENQTIVLKSGREFTFGWFDSL